MTTPPNIDLRAELRKLVYSPDGKEAPLELFNIDELLALIQAREQQAYKKGLLLGNVEGQEEAKQHQQQLLTELLGKQRKYSAPIEYAVPVSVIEAKLKQTNDGGNT